MGNTLSLGFRSYIKNLMAKPNKRAIWVFGFQKSGTTAIAALLAKHTNESVTLDTHYLWEPYLSQLMNNKLDFIAHINKYSYPFSKNIIKEPNATYIIEDIKKIFDLARYVFIIRNPFDTIRSILNRLNIPGDRQEIDLTKVPKLWQNLFSKIDKGNYIKYLAVKWVEANSNLELIESFKCSLIKYEDFILNKEECIKVLAQSLCLDGRVSIKKIKNVQFQPKGQDQDSLSFFGDENYRIIESVCRNKMEYFGYLPINEQ